MPRLEASDGNFLDLLPVGTEVTYKDYPELRGKIMAYEYHENGKVSPLPYKVYWTDDKRAMELLGSIAWLYPSPSKIIPVPAGDAVDSHRKEQDND